MKVISLVAAAAVAGAGAALAERAARTSTQGGTFSFKDRVAIITGGSRGLGLAIARELAAQGARLAILARNQTELDQAEEDLKSRGASVLPIRCDVTDRAQAEDAIRQVIDHLGRIDILVNNAGTIQVGPVEHMQVEDYESAMKVHLWAPLYLILAALPQMRDRGEGRIVNISSIGGKIAVPHLLPYSASKFALAGLSDGLRAELAKDNIHVTTVAPGLMRTGSPPNAFFKGNHRGEYAWFALFDSLPVSATSAASAAQQIVEACRQGAPELTITPQAKMAVLANHLFPNLFARSMQLFTRLLPGPVGPEGDTLKTGWQSRSALTESALVRPTYEAAKEYNEVGISPVLPG